MNSIKIGRNDPCPCGSTKKYKQCCGLNKLASVSSQQDHLAKTGLFIKATAAFQARNMHLAVSICQDIIRIDPQHFDALNMLGVLAYYAGNSAVAVQLLNRSILSKPDYPDAHNNLSEIYRSSGNAERAIHHLRRALEIKPNYIDALINYGNVLQDIYQYQASLEAYEKVLKLSPQHTGALSNLANLLQQLNRHAEAVIIYKQLIKLDRDYDWARGGLLYAKLNCCDWESIDSGIEEINQAVLAGKRAIKPFDFLTISDSPALQLKCAQIFSECQNPNQSYQLIDSTKTELSKIKIAYVSADFKQHPVSQLLVSVIEAHDRSRFEIIGISLGADDQSAIRARLLSAFDAFYDVRQKSDREIAYFMRELNVDIAIDLTGHTTDARTAIFSHRAAPIQVNFLGFAGTSGADYFDYIIADAVAVPTDQESFFSEKVIRLPNTFFPHDTNLQMSDKKVTRVQAGLPENGFVFCAFNNPYKITRTFFEVWMRLLAKVEGSVIWLSKANDVVKANLRRLAQENGISSNRLVFAERTESLEDHLSRHQLADLFLDTLPYNAHTTASDALWAGLPVLTCIGKTLNGRVAASLLNAAGLSELVTYTLEEYEAMALRLAKEPKSIQRIKHQLQQNTLNYPIFDNEKYTDHLEQAFALMVNEQHNKSH